jgi:hypothetical protein
MHNLAEFGIKTLDIRWAISNLNDLPSLVGSDRKCRCSCNGLDEVAARRLGQGLASVTSLTSLDLRYALVN